MRCSTLMLAGLMLAGATPAVAQDQTAPPPEFKLSGGVTLISDYRFRGLTQTDGDPALQTTLNLNTKQGFYIGTWLSEIDGSGKTRCCAAMAARRSICTAAIPRRSRASASMRACCIITIRAG